MKYLKKYEEYWYLEPLKYKKGDYVLLDLETLINKYINKMAKEIPSKFVQIYESRLNHPQPYLILLNHNDPFSIFYLKEEEIIRKMTAEEIEEFETIKDSNKYNL